MFLLPHVSLIGIVCLVLGVALGRLFVIDRSAILARRESALKAANVLSKMGLSVIPQVLTAYGTGNYEKVAHYIHEEVGNLVDPVKAAAEFGKLFENMLTTKMADPTQAATLLANVQKLATVNGVVSLAK